ncbi:MAG: ADP-ribosylation factor-like protein [Candidatus Heimdallarchaeota archaeon]
MAFILKLFKKIKQSNITIAGLDNAGKTAFVNYLIKGTFVPTVPTAGINRETINLPKLQLAVYDLGGQEKFRGLWTQVNEKANDLIYVIDSTDKARFDLTLQILYEILETQVNELIPVMILLHKHDLPERIELEEFLAKTDFTRFNIKWSCFETSAKTGEGIIKAMTWFIKELEAQTQ